jgi:hypothetical protein
MNITSENSSPLIHYTANSPERVVDHDLQYLDRSEHNSTTVDGDDEIHPPARCNYGLHWLLATILASNTWTLVMTGLPLLITVQPTNYYAKHDGWYTGSDVMRFIEPVGGLLINFAILKQSRIFNTPLHNKELAVVYVFLFGATLYLQGSAFHAAANMFKNALESYPYNNDRTLRDLHYYMRTVWEHDVGHYLYASGLAIMISCYTYSFRDLISTAEHDKMRWMELCLSVFCVIVFAVLVAGVSINFPSGTIVGPIYIILFGYGLVGSYLVYLYRYKAAHGALTVYGSHPVLHYLLLGCTLALVIIVIWIICVGGFKSRSEVLG